MIKCTKKCFLKNYRYEHTECNLLGIKEYNDIVKYAMIFYYKFLNEIKVLTNGEKNQV